MNEDVKKELLKNIQIEKIGIKTELKMVNALLEKSKAYEKELDALLDRMNKLEKLENEIRKMK